MKPTQSTDPTDQKSIDDHPLSDLYPDLAGSKCETPALPQGLLDDLDDDPRSIFAYGKQADGTFSERDRARARILRFLAQHPEGTPHVHITSYVLKGVHPERAEWPTTNDPDHRFVKRFLQSLEDERPHLVENHKTGGAWVVTPTLPLIDLITQGISQTHGSEKWLYDREFAKSLLRTRSELSDKNRNHLEQSFRKYVNRVDEYQLLFDVFIDNGRSSQKRRMKKGYKTRFNSKGRINKTIARFNQALEASFESADCACLATLTSDPGTTDDPSRPNPRSLLELTNSINPAFNRLNQYLKSDPSTKDNTRERHVVDYRTEISDQVTGRPRERLEYIKVLEFAESGLPHLHVLFFDPPRREKDGCPWLIDKQELSDKWQDYGQGQIVDVYPLTKRRDLNPRSVSNIVPETETDLRDHAEPVAESIDKLVSDTVAHNYRQTELNGQYFNTVDGPSGRSGFVCWYRYGNNDLEESHVEALSRSHRIDMEGKDENPYHKTAGAYLGKYLSATFGSLLDVADTEHQMQTSDKAPAWKLACYWASNRHFWSLSEELRKSIDRSDDLDDEAQRAVDWAAEDTVARLLPDYTDRDDLPELDPEKVRKRLSHTLRQPYVRIDFLGAYHYLDIPATDTTSMNIDDSIPWNERESNIELACRGDRPPPTVDVWDSTSLAT